MGNDTVIKVLVRDPATVNFDKICRLALELRRDLGPEAPLVTIETVKDGTHDFDIEGDAADREYWKRKGRSMTELFALRAGLGTADASGVVCIESPTRGLASLCHALAGNHGKVPGMKGGFLYQRGTIPNATKGIVLLPGRATEIVSRALKAVLAALDSQDPAKTLFDEAARGDGFWDEIDDAMAAASRAVYQRARDIARLLAEGRCPEGTTYALAKAPSQSKAQGIALATRDSELPKHLWAAIKAMGNSFPVAAMVISHPEKTRIALLCSMQFPVDVRPVAKELAKRFPTTEFEVNVDRNSIVWDARSGTPGPSPEAVQEAVSAHLAFRKEDKAAQMPRFGAKLGDVIKHSRR